MRDLFKACPVLRVKALTDAEAPGTFEAIVSVFNNIDNDGEVVVPGAFTKTLSDGPKPIVYSHDWMSVPIGQTIQAHETSEGLYVKGRLFVADDEDHAMARAVYAAMRGGALREFSFGGRVTEEARRENDDGSVTYLLNEIDLVEYGPCLKGSNPATRLVAIKSLAEATGLAKGEVPEVPAEGDPPDAEPAQPPHHPDNPAPPATAPAPPETDVPQPDTDVTGPVEVDNNWDADVRSLLELPADADRAAVLEALRTRVATPTPTPSVGGGDPEQREQVAELLLP